MLDLIQRLGYYPKHCVWELTLACNMSCLHCGSTAGSRRPVELTAAQCLGVADELVTLGCEKVSLSGGEPTLAPHWDRLAAHLRRAAVRVNIVTNGWSWTAEQTARARDAGLENVAFSLDGPEQAHDTVRRPGSFRRLLRAIDDCAAAGLPVGVITHINQLNCRQLEQVRELLAQLPVAFWQLQLGVATGQAAGQPGLILPPEALLWLVPQLAHLRTSQVDRPRVFVAENVGYYGNYEQALRGEQGHLPFFVGCQAGCRVIGIQSDGGVKACMSLPSGGAAAERFVEGYLTSEPLTTLWRREDAFALNRRFAVDRLGGFCASCRHGDICRGGCSWLAYSSSGSCHHNRYCFYLQALRANRLDLVPEEPTPAEREALGQEAAELA